MPPVELRPRVGESSGDKEPEVEEEKRKERALKKRQGEDSSSSESQGKFEEELNIPDWEATPSSSTLERGERSVVLTPNQDTQREERSTPLQEEDREAALAERRARNREALDSLLHSVIKKTVAEEIKPRGSLGKALESTAEQKEDRVELDNSDFVTTVSNSRIGRAIRVAAEREQREALQQQEEKEEESEEGKGASHSKGSDLSCTFTKENLQEGEKTPTPAEGEESDQEDQERKQRDFLVNAVPKKGFLGKPEELSKNVSVSASEDSEEEEKEAAEKRKQEQEELLAIPEEHFKEAKKADPPEDSVEYREKFRREELSFQQPESAARLSKWHLAQQEKLEEGLEPPRPDRPPEPKGKPAPKASLKAKPRPKEETKEDLPPWREPKPPWRKKVELKPSPQTLEVQVQRKGYKDPSEIVPVLTRDRRESQAGKEAAYYGREELIPQPATPPQEAPLTPRPPEKRPPPPLKRGAGPSVQQDTCRPPYTEEEEREFEEWRESHLLELTEEEFESIKELWLQQKAIEESQFGVPERASKRKPKRKGSEKSEPEKAEPRLKKKPKKGYAKQVEQLKVARDRLRKTARSAEEKEKECEQIERETRELLQGVEKGSAKKKRRKRKALKEETPEPPAQEKLPKKQKKTLKKKGKKANPPKKEKKKEKRELEARGDGEIDQNDI